MTHLEGPREEVTAGCRQREREREDLGHMSLLGLWVECFGIPGLSPD